MQTRFTTLVGCSVPIQQAPMGPVASPDLAVAVADAGGVGTITAMTMPAESLARLLDGMRDRTPGALSANFLTEQIDEQAVAAAAERVRLVDFFWLDPRPRLVEIAHRAGALAGWQVGSVDEARAAVDAGCDLVTVQGVEAGGHVRGSSPLLPLLQETLDAVDVPVLAAGGITDGHTFAEVLNAGAAGARIGTRLVATPESGAHPAYKQALVDAGADSTLISDAFAVCPLCATSPRVRVLRTAADRLAGIEDDVVGMAPIGGRRTPVPRGAGLPPFAGVEGRVDAMALYAGTGVGSVLGIQPVADVVRELMAAIEHRESQPAG